MKSLVQSDKKEVKKCYKEISEMSHIKLAEEYPLVLEIFHIFSGLYSIEQCAKALEFNNNDVELATVSIVSE
jgi:fructose-bisphosphate aldolase class 1